MKKFLLAFVLVASLSSMVMTDVQARRLGGGSFGRQSSNIGRIAPMQRSMPNQQAQQAQRAANQSQAANAARPASRWGGILGGALLGLGLGALLSHLGIGGDFAGMISTILMLAIIFFAIRFLMRRFTGKRKEQEQAAYASHYTSDTGYNPSSTPEIGSGLPRQYSGNQATSINPGIQNDNWGIPVDFDVPAFLRAAKSYYIRMQAAWDKADIHDIHEFTTPEMFAEIRLQLQERQPGPNITDVVSLNAELLGIETMGNEYMASVKFSGMIRESEGAPAEPFEEIWNMTRPVSKKDGWVLAGIQQLS